MVGLGVIGYGYWGPNLVRNLHEVAGARVVGISDCRPDRLAKARSRYPAVETMTDFRDLIAHPEVDAIAVATPVSTHFPVGLAVLQANKHLFLEKPMTETAEQSMRLVEEADRRQLVLAVDHTFTHTGSVRKIQELVAGDVLGDIYYYDSVRVNLGLFQHDVNVLWDLAVHDLAIMDAILPVQPCAVATTGLSHVSGEPENIAYLTVLFETNLIAHIHVNWLAPVKIRRTLIGGSSKMIVYDDLEPSEKVKVYDKGITVNGHGNGNGEKIFQMLVGYRTGDMWAPQLDMREALGVELAQFVHCIEHRERPTADGLAGWRVVRILEAATRSMRERGRLIELEPSGCVV